MSIRLLGSQRPLPRGRLVARSGERTDCDCIGVPLRAVVMLATPAARPTRSTPSLYAAGRGRTHALPHIFAARQGPGTVTHVMALPRSTRDRAHDAWHARHRPPLCILQLQATAEPA